MVDLRVPSMLPPNVQFDAAVNQQRIALINEEGQSAFDQFLQSAIDTVNETNMRIIESDIEQVNFATGRTNDMLTVVLAQERAGSALSFTVQVTNRIVEAYREIMRMQV